MYTASPVKPVLCAPHPSRAPPPPPFRCQVALDLKEVVQQQQAQLEQQQVQVQGEQQLAGEDWRLPAVYAAAPDAAPAPPASAPAAPPAKPHIAQLQRLVRDMRAELRQPLPDGQGLAAAPSQAQALQQKRQFVTSWGGPGGGGAADQGPVAPLAAAGQLQQQSGGNVQQQQLQQAELEAARREADCARGERERLRRALIDAEIELQVRRVVCLCASFCAWKWVCGTDRCSALQRMLPLSSDGAGSHTALPYLARPPD